MRADAPATSAVGSTIFSRAGQNPEPVPASLLIFQRRRSLAAETRLAGCAPYRRAECGISGAVPTFHALHGGGD